jgi:hypothetical protein
MAQVLFISVISKRLVDQPWKPARLGYRAVLLLQSVGGGRGVAVGQQISRNRAFCLYEMKLATVRETIFGLNGREFGKSPEAPGCRHDLC